MLAPICLFTYNRLSETRQTIEALQCNYLASESELFVFSDGPKNEAGKIKIESIREYIHSISGFKSVEIFESTVNKGLAISVIHGVSQIIEKYGKIIVLEDDLVTSPNFLDFMNQSLEYYSGNKNIFSISGFTMKLPSLDSSLKDYYLGYRASSWGWGTWLNRWETIDWDAREYISFLFNPLKIIRFMKGGSDMPYMLWKQKQGIIDSWAIRWCYHQCKTGQLTVFASKSKIRNIGIGKDATHTKKCKRFDCLLDDDLSRNFQFDMDPLIDYKLVKEFKQQHSIKKRLIDLFA